MEFLKPKINFSMGPTWGEIVVNLDQGQGQRMKNGLKMDLNFLPKVLICLNMSGCVPSVC